MAWRAGQKVIMGSTHPDARILGMGERIATVDKVLSSGRLRVGGDLYNADGTRHCRDRWPVRLLAVDDATAERLEDERKARPLVLEAIKRMEFDMHTPCPLTHSQAVQLLGWLSEDKT